MDTRTRRLIIPDCPSTSGVCDYREEHAMTEREDIRRAEWIPEPLAAYLGMTTPTSPAPKRQRRRRDEQVGVTRPPIDNRGLSLEEGNDFA
jgi:hypothetical protein